MLTPIQILNQINQLIGFLIEVGLADRQQAAISRGNRSATQVTFHGASNISIAMKDRFYSEIYYQLVETSAFNAKMLDGALIQMMYEFSQDVLQRHRLAFFPSPDLEEFQNNPEIYLTEESYADIVAKNIVSFPIRFDYENRDGIFVDVEHPKSHLTLGQYEHCRIPVSSPLTPARFVEFIVRNFYHTAFVRFADKLPKLEGAFTDSISLNERNLVHITIPQ